MKRILSAVAMIGFLSFCLVAGAEDKVTQGVKGKVIKMVGDFMPTVVDENNPAQQKNRQKLQPLPVKVHVFKGKVRIFEKPDPKHPQLVKIVTSNKDGEYSVELEPGKYTVVAEIGGKLYLNSFQSDNTWTTCNVVEGKWTEHDIRDTSEAAF